MRAGVVATLEELFGKSRVGVGQASIYVGGKEVGSFTNQGRVRAEETMRKKRERTKALTNSRQAIRAFKRRGTWRRRERI